MENVIEGLSPEQINPHQFGGMCSRESVVLQKKEDTNFDAGIDTIATTEAPSLIVDWERWQVVREILPMRYCVIPDNNETPFLDSHSRVSIEKVLGRAYEYSISGDQLLCKTFVSSTEEKLRTKIKEGIVKNVSLGYMTNKEYTVEVPKKAEVLIDGIAYRNDYTDEFPLLVRTWWKPGELSAVPIGADKAAKFKAEMENKIIASDPDLQKKLNEAYERVSSAESEIKNLSIKLNERGNKMADQKTPEEIRKEERERVSDIEAMSTRLAKNFKGDMAAAKELAIKEDWSAERFSRHLFQNFDESKPVETPVTDLDLSEKELDKFSITRALEALTNERSGGSSAWKNAGHESEVLQESTKRALQVDGVRGHGGIFLPADYIAKRMAPAYNQRTVLNATTGSQGQYLVGQNHLASEFIDLPRNRPVALELGVRYLSGLKGTLQIPKQLSSGTFAWGAENFNADQSNLTLGQILCSPKEGKSSTTYGKQLFFQSSPGVDQIVNQDLLTIAKIGLDLAIFHGAGGTAPTGVTAVSGVGSFNGVNVSWEDILEAESDISVANLDAGSLKFATNPTGRAILKGREVVQGGNQGFIMDRDGKVNGYDTLISNQISAGYLNFGNWSYTWLLDWLLYEVLVNPYKDESGNVTVTIFVYADVAQAIATALTVADDLS